MKPILMILASLVLLVMVFVSGVVVTAKFIADPEPHKFANIDTPDLWTSRPKEVDTATQPYQRLPDATQAVSVAAKPVSNAVATTASSQQPMPASSVDSTVTAAIDADRNAIPGTSLSAKPLATSVPLGNSGNSLDNPNSGPAVDAARAEWCFARYKSYRVDDNTYQPYDGSPRRQCQGSAGASSAVDARSSGQNGPDVAAIASSRIPHDLQSRDDMRPLPTEDIPYTNEDGQVYDGEPDYDQPRAVEAGAAAGSHEEWCVGRYRSYRAEDNSYQPFEGGPRRQCQSPFG